MPSDQAFVTGDSPTNAFPKGAVVVRGQVGYLFFALDHPGYCFVPGACISRTPDGRVAVNEVEYLNSGWGTRNQRFGETEAGGKFVFPDPSRMVIDLEAPEARRFLQRLG